MTFHVYPFFFALLVSALVPGLLVTLALQSWRRLPEEPWTERARQLHPIRAGHAGLAMVLPFTLVVAGVCFRPEASPIALLTGAVLGGILAGWPVDRAVFPSFDFPKWMRACGVFSAIKLSWLFLLLFFALAIPNQWSPAHLGWALAFLVVTTALSAGVMHRLLVAIRIIRPGERAAAFSRDGMRGRGKRPREIGVGDSFALGLRGGIGRPACTDLQYSDRRRA